MKRFVLKYKNIILIFFILLLVVLFFTTTSITTPMLTIDERIDQVPTVSTPTGSVVARGVDISSYQGEVDFAKVKSEGYSFVVLRLGTSKGIDKMFNSYYKEATEAGLDVGCYYYTYATTVEESKQEAYEVLQLLQGKTFTYPVFYDFEYPELLSYDRRDVNTQMVEAFCIIIKRGGFYPGVYTASSYHSDFFDTSVINSNFDVWIANYDYVGVDNYGYSNTVSMWQYTNAGTVNGINTDVDINLCFVDYPSIIEKFNYRVSKIR